MNRAILVLTAVIAAEATFTCVSLTEASQRIQRLEVRVLGGCAPPVEKSLAGACSDINTASRLGIGVSVEGVSTSLDDLSTKVDDLSDKIDSMSGTVDDIAAKLNL